MSRVIRSSSYEIFIGNDSFLQLENFLSKHYSNRKLFILTDENTKALCLPLLSGRLNALKNAVLLEMQPGEKNKSLVACETIWKELTENQADRRSLLINLGGGVVCDTGGFTASTYMRGIDFINIPTSLLAMVDASAGGKNGINFSGLKNQIGTFTKPAAVFISPSFLKTLPERELKSGFAEIIKHALIADQVKWRELKQLTSLEEVDWINLIEHSVRVKNKIVNSDFKDRNRRMTLNFGHTIGHALESYSHRLGPDALKHGEAIAMGMIGEIFLSRKMHGFPEEDAHEIISFIQRMYQDLSPEVKVDGIMELIHADKKNERSEVNFVLLRNIADPVIRQRPEDGLIREAVEFSLQQFKTTVDQG